MGKVLKLNPKKKKSRYKQIIIITLLVLLILFLWLNSSFFAVSNIEIEGNERISDETIMENLHIEPGMNLISYCIRNRKQEFELHPLIRTADVYIHWPDTIQIEITEKEVMGYIPYMGLYLCVDATGCVLDSIHEVDEGTPVLTGISVDSFSLGETVDTKDTERFQIMLECLSILTKYELSSKITEIAVPSADAIHFYMEGLDISCGGKEDLDRKVSTVVSILEDVSRPSGILHVENLDEQVYIESTESKGGEN